MNCETIDKLLSSNSEIGNLLNIIGENTDNRDLDEVWDAVFDHHSTLYTALVYEAIKAHMNRYLYLWGNLERTGCEVTRESRADLLKEIDALRDLLKNQWLFGGVSKKDTDETGETDGEFKDMFAHELRELIAERMRYWLECNQTEWGTPGAYKKEFAVGDEIITLLKTRRHAPEM